MTNLFCRALQYQNKTWVYGLPIKRFFEDLSISKNYLISNNCNTSDSKTLEDHITRVIPESITWSSGILDKTLTMIYEGDIVQTNNGNKFVVIFKNGKFSMVPYDTWKDSKTKDSFTFYTYDIYSDNSEVVGNIFEDD